MTPERVTRREQRDTGPGSESGRARQPFCTGAGAGGATWPADRVSMRLPIIATIAAAGALAAAATLSPLTAEAATSAPPVMSSTFLQPSGTTIPWTAKQYSSEISLEYCLAVHGMVVPLGCRKVELITGGAEVAASAVSGERVAAAASAPAAAMVAMIGSLMLTRSAGQVAPPAPAPVQNGCRARPDSDPGPVSLCSRRVTRSGVMTSPPSTGQAGGQPWGGGPGCSGPVTGPGHPGWDCHPPRGRTTRTV